jgi:hypothetical protein
MGHLKRIGSSIETVSERRKVCPTRKDRVIDRAMRSFSPLGKFLGAKSPQSNSQTSPRAKSYFHSLLAIHVSGVSEESGQSLVAS